MKKPKKGLSISAQKAMWGRFFLLPWMIGIIFFFFIPFAKTVIYAFSSVRISNLGVKTSFTGMENLIHIFTKEADFVKALPEVLFNMVVNVFIITFISLLVGVILRSKFAGRTFARAMFFFPVIISSGVVIQILKEVVMMSTAVSSGETSLFNAYGFGDLLIQLNMPPSFIEFINGVVNGIFDLVWKSGVQILLFLSALNSIPSSCYEVADVEGATAWEKFWKITWPMVLNTFLVVVIYTIIDSFTDYGNAIMRQASTMLLNGRFNLASAMSLVYFLGILVIVLIVSGTISRNIRKKFD